MSKTPAASGWPFVFGGVLLTCLGMLLLESAPPGSSLAPGAYLAVLLGGLAAAVGVIAAGVTIGIARADQLRQHRD